MTDSAKSVTSNQSVKFIIEMGLDKQKKTEASSTEAQSETQSSRVQQRKGTTTTVTTYVGTVNKRIQSEHKLPPLPPILQSGGGYSPASLLKAKKKFVQDQKMFQNKQLEKQQRKEKQQQEKNHSQSNKNLQQRLTSSLLVINKYQNNPLLQSELGQINEQETYQSHSDRSYTISDPAQTPTLSQRFEEPQAQYSASEQFKTEESPKQQFTENLPTINEKSESQLQTSPRVQPRNPNFQDVQTSKFQVDIESSQSQSESENVKVEITKQQIIVQKSQSEEVIIEQVIQNIIDEDQQSIGQSIYQSLITKAIVQQSGEEIQIAQQDIVETQTTQINVIQQVQKIVTENVVQQVILIEDGDQQTQQQQLIQEQENLYTDIQNIQLHSNESENMDQTKIQDGINQEEQQNISGEPVKDVDQNEKKKIFAHQNEEQQDQDQLNQSEEKLDKDEISQITNQIKSGNEVDQQNEDLLKEQLQENQQQIKKDYENNNQNPIENREEKEQYEQNEKNEQNEQKEGNQQSEQNQQQEQKGDQEQVGNQAIEDNEQIRENNQMQQGVGQEPLSVGEGQGQSIGDQEIDHQNIIQQQVVQPQDDEQIVDQEQLRSVEQMQQQQNTLLQQGPDDQELGNPIGINQDQTIQIQEQPSIDNPQFQQEDQKDKTVILDKSDDIMKQTTEQQEVLEGQEIQKVQEEQVQQKIEEIEQNKIKEENQQQDDNTSSQVQGQQQTIEISNLGNQLGGQNNKNEDNQVIPRSDDPIHEKQQVQGNEQQDQQLNKQEAESHNDLKVQEENSLKRQESEEPTNKQNFEENQQEFQEFQGSNQNAQEETNLVQDQNQDEITEREASQNSKNSGNQFEDSLIQHSNGPIRVEEQSQSKIISESQSESSQKEIVIQDGQLEKKENKDENENQKIDEHKMENEEDIKIVKEENQQEKLSDEGSLNNPLGNKADEESLHKSLGRQAESDEEQLNNPLGNKPEADSDGEQLNNPLGGSVEGQLNKSQDYIKSQNNQQLNEEQNAQETEKQKTLGNPLLDTDYQQQIADQNRLQSQQSQQSFQSFSSHSRMVESVERRDEVIEISQVINRSYTIQEKTTTSTINLGLRSNSMGQNDLINSPEGSSQEDQTSIMKNLVNRSYEVSFQQIEIQQMDELLIDQIVDQQIEQIDEQVIIVKEHKLTQLEQEIQQFDVQLDQDSSLQFILDIKRLDKTELEKLFKETQDAEKRSVIKHLLKLNQEKENEALDFIKNDINYTSEYENAFKSNIIELLLTLDEVLEEIQDLKQESLDDVVGRVTLRQTQKFIDRIPKMVDDQIEQYKQKLQEQIESIQNINEESLNDPILKIIQDKVRQNQEKQQTIYQLNDQCQKQLKLIEELKQQNKVQEEILQQQELIIKSIPPSKNNPQEQQNQLITMDIGILFDWSSQQEVVDDQNLKEFLYKYNAYKHQQFDKFRIQQDYSLNQLFQQYQNKDQQLKYIYSQLTQTRLINNFDDVSETNIKEYFAVLLKFKEFLFQEEQKVDDHHSSIQEIIKRRELQLITEKQKYGDNQVILMKIFQQISQAQILSNYQKVDKHNYEEFFIALLRFKQLTFEQYNRAIRENQEQNHQDKMLQQDQSQNVSLEQLSQTLIKKYEDVQEKYQTPLSQNLQQSQQEVIDVITVDDEIITKYEQIKLERKQLEQKLQDQLDQNNVQKQQIELLNAQIDQQAKQNQNLLDEIQKDQQILGYNQQNIEDILKVKQEICELIKTQQNVQLEEFLQLVKKEITQLRKSQQEHTQVPIQKEQESQINEEEINQQSKANENQQSQDQSGNQDIKSTGDNKDLDQQERELLQNYISQLKDEVESLRENIIQLQTDNAGLKDQLKQEFSKNAILAQNDEDIQIKREKVSEDSNQGIQQVQEPPQYNNEGNERGNLQKQIAQLIEENNLLKQEMQQSSQNMESEKLKYQQSEGIIEDLNKKFEKQKEDIDQQEELIIQLIKQSKLIQQEHHDNIQELLAKQKGENQKVQELAEQKEIETRNWIEKYWTDQFSDQSNFQEQDYSQNSVIQTINESFSKQFKQTLTQSNIHEDITIIQLIQRYDEIRSYVKKILEENFNADQRGVIPKLKYQPESIGEQLEYIRQKISELVKVNQETEQYLTDKINNLVEERNEDAQKIDFLEQQLIDKQKYDDQPSEPHTQRISVSDHNLEELNDVTLIDKVIQDLKKINYFDLTVNQEDQYKDFIDGFLIQKMEIFKKYDIDINLSINQVLQKVQQLEQIKQKMQSDQKLIKEQNDKIGQLRLGMEDLQTEYDSKIQQQELKIELDRYLETSASLGSNSKPVVKPFFQLFFEQTAIASSLEVISMRLFLKIQNSIIGKSQQKKRKMRSYAKNEYEI